MSKFIKNFFCIIVPFFIVLLIILELFFRFAVPATEVPQDFFDEKDLIFRFDAAATKEGLYTYGVTAQQRGKWRINNCGWNSPIDYFPKGEKKRIAVFGDSNIEALQVDCDKSYPSVLRKLFNDSVEVYSFGKTGASSSEYLNFSRYADKYFQPDILIFNVVNNDFYESILKFKPSNIHILTLNINDSNVTENLPGPDYTYSQYNWKKRLIKQSALFRYISHNLNLRKAVTDLLYPKNEKKIPIITDVNTKTEDKRDPVRQAIDYILGKISEENPGKRIIFVTDMPNLTESNRVQFSNPLNNVLLEYCSKYKFEFIDMANLITEDYEKNRVIFYSELDGHYNEHGHRFAAEQIFRYLTQKK